jgi:hypothetical protein
MHMQTQNFSTTLTLSKVYQLINTGVLTDNFGTYQRRLAITLALLFEHITFHAMREAEKKGTQECCAMTRFLQDTSISLHLRIY